MPANLSLEEMAVLKECREEALKYRGIPGGLLGLGATFLAAKQGLIVPRIWKYCLNGVLCYLIGTFTYAPVCARKIRERLPQGSVLYGKNRTGYSDYTEFPQEEDTSDHSSASSHGTDLYTNTNIDTSRPSYDLDSSHALQQRHEEPESKPRITYDDLRARHRGVTPSVGERKTQGIERSPLDRISQPEHDSGDAEEHSSPATHERRKPSFFADTPVPDKSGSKNKYGDVWDKI